MATISPSFVNSTVLSSFAFLFLVWLITHKAIYSLKIQKDKKLKFSFFTALILVGWFALVFVFGKIGFFAMSHLVAPYILIGFILLLGVLQKVYASTTIQTIADAIPAHWIIGIQTYRVVGIGFLILYSQGILPATFAFPAGIGDIIIGITAPFVAYLYFLKKPYAKKLAINWNILGIADLVIALAVGIAGYPRPLQLIPLTPSTEPFSLYPLVLIPLFAVPLALLLHFCSLRTLRDRNLY